MSEKFTPPVDISKGKDGQPAQPKLCVFPKSSFGNQQRSFNSSWYDKYKLLEYSKGTDKVYCFPCRHFSFSSTSFVTGFSDWKNLSKKLEEHFLSPNSPHRFSQEKYLSYIQAKSKGSVASQISVQQKKDTVRNREVLASHVEIILLCALQDIALRGHRESDTTENRGNFLEIVEFLKKRCPEFAKKPAEMPRNGKYLDPNVQNELIELSGKLLYSFVLNEINASGGFFSVIADETKDKGGSEQLSICIRYLAKGQVVERFLKLLDSHSFDSNSIANSIIQGLNEVGLSMKNCVSQAYDGPSVMSGDMNGVKVHIEKSVGGRCPYIHCYAHRLNLVLVDCCTRIQKLREFLSLIQAIYTFQSHSVLRSEYFQRAQVLLQYEEILKMPQSGDTRWTSKKKGVSYFRSRIDCIVIALEEIIERGKSEEIAECKGYLDQLESFEFLLLLVIMDEVLGWTNCLSEYLQCPKLLCTRAATLCDATIKTLSDMRSVPAFQRMWEEASGLAAKIFVSVPDPCSRPSVRRRKVASKRLAGTIVESTLGSRETECGTIAEKFRGIYYEVLDTFLAELRRRLVDNSSLLQGLTASDPENDFFLHASEIIPFCGEFSRFGINLEQLKSEIPVARNLLLAEKLDRVVDCYQYLLKMNNCFPNLVKYYSLVMCFPVSNASSERSFSSLNRIKSFLRTTMGQQRTSYLTLLSMNRDLTQRLRDNPLLVVDEFGKAQTRRLSFIL